MNDRLQSEQASITQKQSSGWLAKHTTYHFILTEKTQNLYAHTKEAEDGLTSSSSRMIDLRTEEGDGRGHKA